MISLWMCKNAIYTMGSLSALDILTSRGNPSRGYKEDDYVTCSKGHDLGKIYSRMVEQGKPLICKVCQGCKDVDIMGDNLKKEERGW